VAVLVWAVLALGIGHQLASQVLILAINYAHLMADVSLLTGMLIVPPLIILDGRAVVLEL
jgi:hypothetical protein